MSVSVRIYLYTVSVRSRDRLYSVVPGNGIRGKGQKLMPRSGT